MKGLSDANFEGKKDKAKLMKNFVYGPWTSKAWFRKYQGLAKELSMLLGPDDMFLLFCWGGICADKGWTSLSHTNKAARKYFRDTLKYA